MLKSHTPRYKTVGSFIHSMQLPNLYDDSSIIAYMNNGEDEDINEMLGKYSENATQFIATTSTIEEMIRRGLKIDPAKPETEKQFIDRIYDEHKNNAFKLIKKLPLKPNIALPPITSLYDEITECILFGQSGAAITLSAILVEFALKHAIVDRKAGVEKYDGAEWDRVEKKELGPVIKEVEEMGMFNEQGINNSSSLKTRFVTLGFITI
jgi:hypothetical protein